MLLVTCPRHTTVHDLPRYNSAAAAAAVLLLSSQVTPW
jgi:hypothetical protein